ncbi:MAG: PAS domain-containing sensor histidine kinase [Gemmatimonadota bacterium]
MAHDAPTRSEIRGLGPSVPLDDLHRLLIDSVRDYAIFALDREGYVLSWNPGAERFKGYQAHEIIGKHFSTFYTDEARATNHPAYELKVATEEGRYEEEGWRVRKDGTNFWANVTITALRDASGTLVGFAKVTRDLTERRKAQDQAIEDARRVAQAEAANRAKGEFLAALSHELRTPLNAIGGYLDLVLFGVRGPLSDDVKRDLERVRDSQQHLLALINDLLNFSRVEAGRLTYTIEPFAVDAAIDSVVMLMEGQAESRDIVLARAACPGTVNARADAKKVEQILVNLVGNAIKFTEAGGRITLSCAVTADEVTIAVTDTGSGIPADKLHLIFEPFVQLGRNLTSSHEGAGLGLAISSDLARAMGGELRAESEIGRGSTFTLILPRG